MRCTKEMAASGSNRLFLPVQVVDIVADRIPEIVQMGVPIPEHIPFNLDNVIPDPSKLSQGQVQLGELMPS